MTNTRIKQLQRQAAEAGDIHMAAVAARALGESYENMALNADERASVDAMTADQARAQCVKVIVYSDGEATRS